MICPNCKLSEEDKLRFYNGYLENMHTQAILKRAKGLFEAANYFAERAHQWENMRFIQVDEFPGMQSAWLDELVRFYKGKP